MPYNRPTRRLQPLSWKSKPNVAGYYKKWLKTAFLNLSHKLLFSFKIKVTDKRVQITTPTFDFRPKFETTETFDWKLPRNMPYNRSKWTFKPLSWKSNINVAVTLKSWLKTQIWNYTKQVFKDFWKAIFPNVLWYLQVRIQDILLIET